MDTCPAACHWGSHNTHFQPGLLGCCHATPPPTTCTQAPHCLPLPHCQLPTLPHHTTCTATTCHTCHTACHTTHLLPPAWDDQFCAVPSPATVAHPLPLPHPHLLAPIFCAHAIFPAFIVIYSHVPSYTIGQPCLLPCLLPPHLLRQACDGMAPRLLPPATTPLTTTMGTHTACHALGWHALHPAP